MRHHAGTRLDEGSGADAEAARNCARRAASSNGCVWCGLRRLDGRLEGLLDDRLDNERHRRDDGRQHLRLGRDGTE